MFLKGRQINLASLQTGGLQPYQEVCFEHFKGLRSKYLFPQKLYIQDRRLGVKKTQTAQVKSTVQL